MPGVPIEIPSDTVMVLKVMALAPARLDSRGGQSRQLVDVHIAGRQVAPGRGNADLRLFEIGIEESNGTQHRAAGRLRHPVDHNA